MRTERCKIHINGKEMRRKEREVDIYIGKMSDNWR
jgi:hypothetical protein